MEIIDNRRIKGGCLRHGQLVVFESCDFGMVYMISTTKERDQRAVLINLNTGSILEPLPFYLCEVPFESLVQHIEHEWDESDGCPTKIYLFDCIPIDQTFFEGLE